MEYKFKATPMPRRNLTTGKVMTRLLLGLLVVYAYGLYNSYNIGGKQYLVNTLLLLLVAVVTSIVCEVIYALMMKKNIGEHCSTSFPAITALILVLTVPANTSLYAIAVATVIAIVFGKLVFGGFGQNIFNPAAVGRAVIISSFATRTAFDAVTGATIATQFAKMNWIADANSYLRFVEANGGYFNILMGNYAGAIGETCTLIILAVGVWMTIWDVIDWRIPATYLGLLFGSATIAGLVKGLGIDYALMFVSTGGAAFGAVFMLTDPVTNPQTRPGKIVFAALAALFTIAIRFLGNMPEGVVFSILLANMISPAIDKLFSSKQITSHKRNIAITLGTVACVLLCGALIACSVEPGKYAVDANAGASETVEEETDAEAGASGTDEEAGASEDAGVTGTFADTDLSKYPAAVKSVDGDTYIVTAGGFHALEGGPDNEFEIVITDGKVVSVKCTVFSDTQGVGTIATADDALAEFEGVSLTDEIDAVSGATYTSNSVNAAVQAALKEANK